jgi:ribonuclease D
LGCIAAICPTFHPIYRGAVAIDIEAVGLDVAHDRLCVVHLSQGDGSADVLQIPQPRLSWFAEGAWQDRRQ